MFLSTFLFLSLIYVSSSLTAYDCESNIIEKMTLSLVDIPSCEKKTHNISKEMVKIQVVQPRKIDKVPYYQCIVYATHYVQHCGYFIDSVASNGIISETYHVSREMCLSMHKTKKFDYDAGNGLISVDLENNGIRNEFTRVTWGKINEKDGKCNPIETITSKGVTYNNVVRTSAFTVIINQGLGQYNLDNEYVTFESGDHCLYSKGSCFVSDYGNTFWDQIVYQGYCPEDTKSLIVIYEGPSEKITEHKAYGSIEVSYKLTLREKDYIIPRSRLPPIKVCALDAYRSEHSLISIIEESPSLFFTLKQDIDRNAIGQNLDLITQIDSKIIYASKHVTNQIDKLYMLYQYDRCITDQRSITSYLSQAMDNPREFAYQYFQSPGYTAVVRGQVVHLSKCMPVEVNYYNHHPNICTNELPVIYKNQSYYLTTRSRLLVKIATEIDCLTEVTPMHKVAGSWYSLLPHGLMKSEKPSIMKVDREEISFEELRPSNLGGIYSESDMKKFQDALMEPMTDYITGDLIKRAMQDKSDLPKGVSFINKHTQGEFELSIQSKIDMLYSKVKSSLLWWNEVCSIGFGIFVFYRITKMILNWIINFFIMYKEFGVSWETSLFFWENMVHHLIRKKYKPTNTDDCENTEEISLKNNTADRLHPTAPTELQILNELCTHSPNENCGHRIRRLY